MDSIKITSGNKLYGIIPISGAKNAALPLIAASLLTHKTLILKNVPYLTDIKILIRIILSCGAKQKFNLNKKTIHITTNKTINTTAPYDLVSKIRASFLILGPILGRCGYAKISLPGGCNIGTRPVDLHLKGFKELGAEINFKKGYIIAKVPNGRLKGNKITFNFPSVGATQNILMGAVLAKGKTILNNVACDPEIDNLIKCLNKMGAKITKIKSSILMIKGVKKLYGTTHTILPDRIETGTYAIAVIITGGDVILTNTSVNLLPLFLDKLRETGAIITKVTNGIRIQKNPLTPIKPVDIITQIYPGFPTDLQSQFMTLMTIANGSCLIHETIFENRFLHIKELIKMGANIKLNNNTAKIIGVKKLNGTEVTATDLRASASLIIAGLIATGNTIIKNIYHLDRGFEFLENKFKKCGVKIKRLSTSK